MEFEIHPLVRFGERRGWGYAKTAKHFDLKYGVFKQIVRGFVGCSFERAELFEQKTGGEVTAIDVMRWHQRNRRDCTDARAAS